MTRRPDRRPSSRPSRDERREEFLGAAVTAIRRDGPKVSMEAIAREAGVTKPIVYRHFGDRQGLVRALGSRLAGQVVEEVLAAVESAGDDPRQMIRQAMTAYVAMIEADPDVYRVVTEEMPAGLSADVARAIARVLGEQLRARGLDSGAAEPWAYGIVGLAHHAGDWWVRNPTIPRDQLVTYLVDLLWGGFVALGPGERR